jgi:hypothetical protein
MTSIFGESYDGRFSISMEIVLGHQACIYAYSIYIYRANWVDLKILQNIYRKNIIDKIKHREMLHK